jgi:hypothetical protein
MVNPYDWDWQKLRAQWDAYLVANGTWPCRRCHRPVYCDRMRRLNRDGRKFDLGHAIDVQHGGTNAGAEPEHSCCNRSAGKLAQLEKAREPASEEW